MGITSEQRLEKLDDELRRMKGAYNTAGSLVRMYVTEMGEQTVGGAATLHDVTYRFTPTYGLDMENLITLYPIVKVGGTILGNSFEVLPQDGSGTLDVKVYGVANGDTINIIASGTSPGTFALVA
jgi:hypothetical protein